MFNCNIFFLLFSLSITSAYSQGNLLINGSFEDYIACPDWINELDSCTNWSQPTAATSDYYNSCSTSPFVSIPNTMCTNAAYDGNAYAGIYFYSPLSNDLIYVEYIQGQTISPLEAGVTYKLSMMISLSMNSGGAVNEFGAYFSEMPFYDSTTIQLDLNPQCVFHNPDFYTTIGDWMYAEGTFVAQGGENYVTIGTFKQPNYPDVLVIDTTLILSTSYMIIDDVKLKEVIEGQNGEEPQPSATTLIPNIFTPDGDGKNDLWKPRLPGYETYTISILNRWGEQIYQAPAAGFGWNGETTSNIPCSEGVYFYIVDGTNISGFFELIR